MKVILILFILFISSSSWANLNVRKVKLLNKELYFIVEQQQNGFKLDLTELKPNQLQNKLFTKFFKHKNEAEKYIEHYLNAHQIKVVKSSQVQKISTENSQSVIWETKKEWSLVEEQKFSDWVKENLTDDFFSKYQIATDCADVAFGLRWIYARIMGLPAAQTLAGSGIIFSNESFKNEWNHLARHEEWHKDEVFLAALKYLFDHVYTSTLFIDTYPIAITKEALLVGTINLLGNHTLIISKIDYETETEIPIKTLNSTVPQEVRLLDEEVYFPYTAENEEDGGLVKMRWPIKIQGQWKLVEKNKMPFYSREQFDENFSEGSSSFAMAVFKRLGLKFEPEILIKEILKSSEEILNDRKLIVEEAFVFCQQNDCAEGTLNYENHSTPSRDKRFIKQIEKGYKFIHDSDASSEFDFLVEMFEKGLKEIKIEVHGIKRSLQDWYKYFKHHLISYDPRDTIEERWGLSQTAIESMVKKYQQRFIQNRVVKIQDAQICREQPQMCSYHSDLYKIHNTYDYDQFRKEQIQSFWLACDTFLKCNNEIRTDNLLKATFFIKSQPTLTLKERLGTNLNQDEWSIIPTNGMYKEISSGFLHINDKQIFDVKSKKFLNKKILEPIWLQNRYIVGLDIKRTSLLLYDTQKNTWKSFKPQLQEGFVLDEISSFGHSFVKLFDGVFDDSLDSNYFSKNHLYLYKIVEGEFIQEKVFLSEDYYIQTELESEFDNGYASFISEKIGDGDRVINYQYKSKVEQKLLSSELAEGYLGIVYENNDLILIEFSDIDDHYKYFVFNKMKKQFLEVLYGENLSSINLRFANEKLLVIEFEPQVDSSQLDNTIAVYQVEGTQLRKLLELKNAHFDNHSSSYVVLFNSNKLYYIDSLNQINEVMNPNLKIIGKYLLDIKFNDQNYYISQVYHLNSSDVLIPYSPVGNISLPLSYIDRMFLHFYYPHNLDSLEQNIHQEIVFYNEDFSSYESLFSHSHSLSSFNNIQNLNEDALVLSNTIYVRHQ